MSVEGARDETTMGGGNFHDVCDLQKRIMRGLGGIDDITGYKN